MNYTSASKKLRIALIVVMVAILGGVGAIFLNYRTDSQPSHDRPVVRQESKADVSLGKIHQVSTRDGIVQWSLDAQSAQVQQKKNIVTLKKIAVTFFLKNGQQAHLTADEGVLRADSSDMDVSGNVVLHYDNFVLETDMLKYRHKKRLVFTDTPVLISDNLSRLMADSASFDLNSTKSDFKGNVEGFLSGQFKL